MSPVTFNVRLTTPVVLPGEAPTEPVGGRERGPDPVDREGGVAAVLERGHDQVAGLGVEVRRDLTVEVVGETVADVRLDQPLVPVARSGVLVEPVDRLDERRHRLEGVGAEPGEPLVERGDVPELRRRHARDGHLVLERRRQLGVLGEPLEGRDLAVRDRAEQVDDRLAVLRVLEGDAVGGSIGDAIVHRGVVRRG